MSYERSGKKYLFIYLFKGNPLAYYNMKIRTNKVKLKLLYCYMSMGKLREINF